MLILIRICFRQHTKEGFHFLSFLLCDPNASLGECVVDNLK